MKCDLACLYILFDNNEKVVLRGLVVGCGTTYSFLSGDACVTGLKIGLFIDTEVHNRYCI